MADEVRAGMLSRDTETADAHVIAGSAPVDRPQPTAAPGSMGAGPWVKTDATGEGGWNSIDGMSGEGWVQT